MVVGDAGIGQDKGSEGDGVGRTGAMLGEDNLIEVGGDGDVGGVPDHLVGDAILAIGIALGQIERAGDDADGGVSTGETAAEVLEVRPVVPVEALTDLGTHVAQSEGGIHGLLAPFGIGGGDLVAAVVAGAKVVGQFGAEHGRERLVLVEGAVLAVAVPDGQRGRREMFGHPDRIPQTTIVRTPEGERLQYIGDGAGKAILSESCWINRGRWQR